MAAPSIKKSYFLIQYSFKPYKHTSDNSYCLTTYLSEPDRYIFAESLTKKRENLSKKKISNPCEDGEFPKKEKISPKKNSNPCEDGDFEKRENLSKKKISNPCEDGEIVKKRESLQKKNLYPVCTSSDFL